MPDGSQNIEDWTIDNFTSVIFPFTTPVEEYREYVLAKNLKVIPDEIVKYSNVRSNNPNREGRGTEFTINTTLGLQDPGNLEFFLGEGNVVYDVSFIRESDNLGLNIYGPSELKMFDTNGIGNYCPDFGNELTSFNQYPIGYSTDIRGSLLGSQLGFGNAAGIDFKVPTTERAHDGKISKITLDDSPLDKVGKERRKIEALNRVKANAAQETLGKINLDPFGRLSNQGLVSQDYSITKPKTAAGKILDFVTSDLLGAQLPVSILPKDIHGDGFLDDNNSDVLLDYTGSGQKSTLYSNIKENTYGPKWEVTKPKTKVGELIKKVVGPSDPPQKVGYISSESLGKGVYDPTKTTNNDDFNIPTARNGDLKDAEEEYQKGGITNSKEHITLGDYVDHGEQELTSDKGKLYWTDLGHKPGEEVKKLSGVKKGLLQYTQKIIQEGGAARYIGLVNSETNIKKPGGKHLKQSQGNLIKENEGKLGTDGYCRSWSVRRAYNTYGDLIRHSKLLAPANGKPNLANREDSVLIDPGVLRIAYDKSLKQKSQSKYMLSIENLAWKDSPHTSRLPNCEKGPNDGRIMWFPPYDISFTDNTSVNWETTNFIGRAEPIYTYNNTERTGTLDFTIIVDHSSTLNAMKTKETDATEAEIDRFLWGCSNIDDSLLNNFLSVEEKNIIEEETLIADRHPEFIEEGMSTPPLIPKIYFENARFDDDAKEGRLVDPLYEVRVSLGGAFVAKSGSTRAGLNETFFLGSDEIDSIDRIVSFLSCTGIYDDDDSGKYYQIQIRGNTSGSNTKEYNKNLGLDRANNVQEYMVQKMIAAEGGLPIEYKDDNVDGKIRHKSEEEMGGDIGTNIAEHTRWVTISEGEDNSVGSPQDEDNVHNVENLTFGAVKARNCTITLKKDTKRVMDDIQAKLDDAKPKQDAIDTITNISKTISKRILSECDIFEKIEKDSPFIYDSLKSKIKSFHPAFHSSTPEMFNSRLTFLQQCTRQGPSLGDSSQPQNLAFGRPPICILRVGDFYHTKIVIDSLSYSFEPLQWDLNPEGIGVQPMIAKVSLSFKFIGGSSLGGPIKQLQNAVSFNFFANTSLYNPIEKFKSSKFQELQDGVPIDKTFTYGAFGSPKEAEAKIESLPVRPPRTTTITNTDIQITERELTDEEKKRNSDGFEEGDENDKAKGFDNEVVEISVTEITDTSSPYVIGSPKTITVSVLDDTKWSLKFVDYQSVTSNGSSSSTQNLAELDSSYWTSEGEKNGGSFVSPISSFTRTKTDSVSSVTLDMYSFIKDTLCEFCSRTENGNNCENGPEDCVDYEENGFQDNYKSISVQFNFGIEPIKIEGESVDLDDDTRKQTWVNKKVVMRIKNNNKKVLQQQNEDITKYTGSFTSDKEIIL